MIYASKHRHAPRPHFRFESIHRLLRVKVAWDDDQSLCWHLRSRPLGCPPEHSPPNQDSCLGFWRRDALLSPVQAWAAENGERAMRTWLTGLTFAACGLLSSSVT